MSVHQSEPQLAHCARCKRLYIRFRWNVCESCLAIEEADFGRIREELHRTPELTLDELAERACVTAACVLRMLDEGLIANANDDDQVCGRCGAPAIGPKQRLCTGCLLELDRQLTQELQDAQMRKREQVMKGKAQGLMENIKARRRDE